MTEEEFNDATARALTAYSDLVYKHITDDHIHPSVVCRAMAQISGVIIRVYIKDISQRSTVIAALIQTLCDEVATEVDLSEVGEQSNNVN